MNYELPLWNPVIHGVTHRTVKGTRRGSLLVHRSIDIPDSYSITALRSGRAVWLHMCCKRGADMLARRLQKFPWDFPVEPSEKPPRITDFPSGVLPEMEKARLIMVAFRCPDHGPLKNMRISPLVQRAETSLRRPVDSQASPEGAQGGKG